VIVVLVLGCAWGVAGAAPFVVRAGAVGSRARATALRPVRSHAFTRGIARGRARFRGAPWSGWTGRIGRMLRAPLAGVRRREYARAVERAIPLALDVLTMAARAGYTPRLALAETARWSPPAVGAVFASVETRCRLGASLAAALDDVGRAEPVLRDVTDALAVAERSGAPVADLLARLADDARVSLRRRSEAHARRVPVRLLFPLVFLVLPAFGLLTVVPALAAGLRSS
jgi:pilus assembly protein TadC